MSKFSLKQRLLLSLISVCCVITCFLALYFYSVKDSLRRNMMFIQAHEITQLYSATGNPNLLPTHYAQSELGYTHYSPQGELLWFSKNLSQPRRLRHSSLQDETQLFRRFIYSGLVINVPVILKDGSILMVSKNDALERKLIDDLLQARLLSSFILLFPIFILMMLWIYWLLKWSLAPINAAALACSSIRPNNPLERINIIPLPSEVRPLAQAVNTSLDRLYQALEIEKSLVANAAHELRTPLTTLSLRIQKSQTMKKVDWKDINTSLKQVQRLTQQLLCLAQADHHSNLDKELTIVSFARVIRETVALLLPSFDQAQRNFQVELSDGLMVRAQAELLSDVIRNLLENALIHGTGTIQIELKEQQQFAVLTINDEGRGVPLANQERFFNRFYKQQQNSPGSGLGLAIAKQTVTNMNGDICFINTKPCTIQIRLPICV